jgi:hypothetical protein
MKMLRVNDLVLIVNSRTGKLTQDGCGENMIFRVAGTLQQGEQITYWLWLEADDEYDGYDGTCVVQQIAPDNYEIMLADERSSMPRELTLVKKSG